MAGKSSSSSRRSKRAAFELEQFAARRGLENVAAAEAGNGFDRWILIVRDGLRDSYDKHPWLGYVTDWLAFAHTVIALFFIGPFLNPALLYWQAFSAFPEMDESLHQAIYPEEWPIIPGS